MMGNRILFTSLVVLLVLGSYQCKTPYHIQNFDSLTLDHETVAVLPFKIINTGVMPEDLTEADILELEAAESNAFQISFYNEVLASTRGGRKNLRVSLQPPAQTNRLLVERGFEGVEALNQPFEQISQMLGVDALVVGQIQKNRLMSDLASYGIEVGIHILDVLSPHPVWPLLPGDLSRSKEIKSMYSLYNGSDGITLWSVSYDYDADWRRKANDIIDETNRRAARKFPYRVR